jgi:hypothetical protein
MAMAMAASQHQPIPNHEDYSSIPLPNETAFLNKGYGSGSGSRPNSYVATNSFAPSDYGATPGAPVEPLSLTHPTRFREDFDGSQRASSMMDGVSEGGGLPQRGDFQAPQYNVTVARNGTLKKKPSLSRKGSLKRSSSKRSLRSGSVRSLNLGEKEKYGGEDTNSAFYVPIPTNGSPTDVLVNRFQGPFFPAFLPPKGHRNTTD